VTAREVRKRLAQCYMSTEAGYPVRIDLPAGSYRAEFHWPEMLRVAPAPDAPQAAVSAARPWRRWGLAAVSVLALSASCVLGWSLKNRASALPGILQKFWAPVMQSSSPVLMCVGTPAVYDVSSRLRNSYLQTLPEEARMRPFIVPFGPDQKISGADLVPQANRYAGFGNLHTTADLVALMSRIGKPWQVRTASDISFAELRVSPAILIGAESNVWTQPLTTELRFYFSRDNETSLIRDRSQPGRQWISSRAGPGSVSEDFAIVSRIIDSKTNNCLVFLGGLTQFGTQAAGELVTHPEQLSSAFHNAPGDWARKNVQLVIRTQIHGLTPSAPAVVAAHFW
jgi:hypothetical protein